MRSYQVCECGAPLRLAESEAPTPQGTQVLMKVLARRLPLRPAHWDGYYEVGGGKKAQPDSTGHQAAAHDGP